jgi:hypothetical protein
MVAGTIAGVGAVYEVFFSGEAVTFFGISSQAVLRTVTAAGAAGRVYEIPAGILFLLHDKPVYAQDLTDIQKGQAEQLRGQKFFSDAALSFLSDPRCAGPGCVTDQPMISKAFADLDAWHEAQEKHLDETDGHWYNPLSWEWHSHHFARSLAEVEIPWAMNVSDLLHMKRAYYEVLRNVLVHDQLACDAAALNALKN